MADTRAPSRDGIFDLNLTASAADYVNRSFLINGAYAQSMGYSFVFVEYPEAFQELCGRHENVNWCKVGLLSWALQSSSGCDYVLYMDSDAFFSEWLTLGEFLDVAQRHRSKVWNGTAELASAAPRSVRDGNVSVILPQDVDEYRVSAGIMLWRPGPVSLEILDFWAKRGELGFDNFPAEQQQFKKEVMAKYSEHIVRVHSGNATWHVQESDGYPNGRWIRHVTGGRNAGLRETLVQAALDAHAAEVEAFMAAGRAEPGSACSFVRLEDAVLAQPDLDANDTSRTLAGASLEKLGGRA